VPLSEANKTADDDASIIQVEGPDGTIVDVITATDTKKRLCVDTGNIIISSGNISIGVSNIYKKNTVTIASKNETDISSTDYTVPGGKSFALSFFDASFDAQSTVYIRIKKQTGGAGAWEEFQRSTLEVMGQGQSGMPKSIVPPVLAGVAGDKFKITYETGLIKGTLFVCFAGVEY